MPRRIDSDARDAEIAAACFRVLEREGLAGLSVRGVAAEAGIAAASLRRAFPTQHALRERCLELIEERVRARITAITATGRARVEEMLAQLLPLDGDRRLELIAQVQLGVLALTDPNLRPSVMRLTVGVASACQTAVQLLSDASLVGQGRDARYEAERLHALLDGLAMHALWAGEAIDAAATLRVLEYHLDDIAAPAQGYRRRQGGRKPLRA